MIMCVCNICDKNEQKSCLKKISLDITPNTTYEYQVCHNCMASVLNIIKMLKGKEVEKDG